jgi:hypothetical protein
VEARTACHPSMIAVTGRLGVGGFVEVVPGLVEL